MQGRFLAIFALASGLAALAAALLMRGAEAGDGLLVGVGAAVGLVAVLGVAVLARILVLAERSRRRG